MFSGPLAATLITCGLVAGGTALAEDVPLTRNVPIEKFQNKTEDVRPYDFDAPPQGMFLSIQTAENYEEELGFRRTHEIVPVNPTDRFAPQTAAIFIVFQLHQHYQGFKVFGLCYLDTDAGPGADTPPVVARDTMQIAMEDESGYLRLSPPEGGWTQGRYKVEIHVGEQVSEISLMGTVRFTVASSAPVGAATKERRQ
jgi:hypothetical protein